MDDELKDEELESGDELEPILGKSGKAKVPHDDTDLVEDDADLPDPLQEADFLGEDEPESLDALAEEELDEEDESYDDVDKW